MFGREPELLDSIGYLGPLLSFSISQQIGKNGTAVAIWERKCTWLPSRTRTKAFNSFEAAKNDSQEIVDRFAEWIAGQ